MTCIKIFSCDLCKDPIVSEGIGLLLERRVDGSHKLRNVLLSDSERHLCNRCCTALQNMFADMAAPPPPRRERLASFGFARADDLAPPQAPERDHAAPNPTLAAALRAENWNG